VQEPYAAERSSRNGPLLLQDFNLIDILAHFDRERIPERVVHAKGGGAHGYSTSSECPLFIWTSSAVPRSTSAPKHRRPAKSNPSSFRFSRLYLPTAFQPDSSWACRVKPGLTAFLNSCQKRGLVVIFEDRDNLSGGQRISQDFLKFARERRTESVGSEE
jgi:hypothetical protein